MTDQKTAILVFAQTAQREGTTKSFRSAVPLFEILNQQTLEAVEKSKLPFFHFSERQQIGKTFGERFINAIQQVYDQGFDNVITIGNDTPHLTAAHLKKTAQQLQEKQAVLGPSQDGGFYLMGLHRSQFNAELFLKLPWQTSRVATGVLKLWSDKKIQVILLEKLHDIDHFTDFKKLIDGFRRLSKKVVKLYYHSVQAISIGVARNTPFFTSFQKETYFNKGSPRLL